MSVTGSDEKAGESKVITDGMPAQRYGSIGLCAGVKLYVICSYIRSLRSVTSASVMVYCSRLPAFAWMQM